MDKRVTVSFKIFGKIIKAELQRLAGVQVEDGQHHGHSRGMHQNRPDSWRINMVVINLLLQAVGNQFKAQIFAASLLGVVLAVVLDLVLVLVQRLLTPWTRHAR